MPLDGILKRHSIVKTMSEVNVGALSWRLPWLVFTLLMITKPITTASLDILFNTGNFPKPKGEISPTNSLVVVGETVRFTCNSTSKFKGNFSQARFKITVPTGKSWFLPTNNQTDLGDSAVETQIYIAENFMGRNTLACFNGDEYIISTKLYAEMPLINVSDVSVILDDDVITTIRATWSVNKEYYKMPDVISTEILYTFGGYPKDWENATRCDPNLDSCDITNGYSGQYDVYLRFKVFYGNSKQRPDDIQDRQPDEAISLHYIFLSDVRKIAKVTAVEVVDVNTTCANLTWTLPQFLRICDQCERYLYKIEYWKEEEHKFSVEASQELDMNIITVCNLTEFTQYWLTVWVKVEEQNPWSDPSSIVELTTTQDRPLTGPVLQPTNYHMERPCEDGQRQVLIYWNSQPRSTIRGKVEGFQIHMQKETRNVRRSSNFFRAELPCSTGTHFKVFTVTAVGPSLVPSELYVPGIEEQDASGLPESSSVMFKVKEVPGDEGQKNLSVTWNPGAFVSDAPQVHLVFYMCEESQPNTCFDDYALRQVDFKEGQLHLEEIAQSQNLFGYSLINSRDQKRGIEWTDCVYLDGQVPGRPTGFKTIPGEEEGSVQVLWANMRCDRSSKVLVTDYILEICPEGPPDLPGCQPTRIDSAKYTSHVFRNLDPGRPYKVSLKAESFGAPGPEVTSIVRSSSGGSSIPTTALLMMILGSAIGVGCFLCCCAWCCCHCRRKQKQMDKTTTQTVKLMGPPLEKVDENSKNSDSGVYSKAGTPPSPSLEKQGPPLKETTQHTFMLKSPVSDASDTTDTVLPYAEVGAIAGKVRKRDLVVGYKAKTESLQVTHIGSVLPERREGPVVVHHVKKEPGPSIDRGLISQPPGPAPKESVAEVSHLGLPEVPIECKSVGGMPSSTSLPSGDAYSQQAWQRELPAATDRKTSAVNPKKFSTKCPDGYTDGPPGSMEDSSDWSNERDSQGSDGYKDNPPKSAPLSSDGYKDDLLPDQGDGYKDPSFLDDTPAPDLDQACATFDGYRDEPHTPSDSASLSSDTASGCIAQLDSDGYKDQILSEATSAPAKETKEGKADSKDGYKDISFLDPGSVQVHLSENNHGDVDV